MANHAELLQGSLFGEAVDKLSSPNASPTPSSVESLKQDLSDQELTADAKARPRTKQNKTTDTISASQEFIDPLEANQTEKLPNWSNHRLVNKEQVTPMLRHYIELKTANPERILLYRLGDFFECFFEDAIKLSRLLEITLTSKEAGKAIGKVPMAGIPHHAAERYCSELIRQGLNVALCDQLETTPSKGNLLKRGITRVLTPGTVIEEGMLSARRNNWVAAIVVEPAQNIHPLRWGIASADVSTGEFLVSERIGSFSLRQEIAKINPAELLLPGEDIYSLKQVIAERINISKVASTPFTYPSAEQTLKTHFKLSTLNGLALKELPLAIRAAGGLLDYINDTQPITSESDDIKEPIRIKIDIPKPTFSEDYLVIDSQTRRNLELIATQRDGQFYGSLLWAVDRTLTAMGGRCLRRWIQAPLINIDEINDRQNFVSALVKARSDRHSIRRLLRSMGDLERLAGRAGAGHAGARDLVAIADGLLRLPHLKNHLKSLPIKVPKLIKHLDELNLKLLELATTIKHQLIDHPPLSLSEGGLIHDGVNEILDGLRNQLDDQDHWLESQEILERQNSGINNLRLQYHRTFGYFLTVSKSKAGQVPEHWIRRQTLANEERFTTPILKTQEGKIFQTKSRAAQKEYELFCALREKVGAETQAIRDTARAVAALDALTGLSEVAATSSFCCPKLLSAETAHNRMISIKDCRHPVVEQLLADKSFVPNDIELGKNKDLIILTGPNASGKSCFLRQIGLVQLLAQIGSWVPASSATLGITDRIFTRVGAVDDLAAGQSTFMVEMAETAFILNQASKRSLVLLDEIGRGTATFDGLSIAWAVSEFLANIIKSRTIFATHYHELNALSKTMKNVSNFQVLVKETGNDLVFLHSVIPGGASRSYGIEAARLAGVPSDVIQRAKEILKTLEQKKINI